MASGQASKRLTVHAGNLIGQDPSFVVLMDLAMWDEFESFCVVLLRLGVGQFSLGP